MKTADVPQQPNPALEGRRKAVYALDVDGHYRIVASAGWEAEELTTSAAVEHFDSLAASALERAASNNGSALEFHMYQRRMDVPTLAQTTGIWRWRVRRHLRIPLGKLPARLRQRYADALGISTDQLARLQTVEPVRG